MRYAIIANIIMLGMVAAGAQLNIACIPYILIGAVCVICTLVTTNKIKPREYPVYIFGISLGLLWQTSLMGVHLVGADIHLEYYISSITMNSGWDWNYPHQYNTSIVVALMTPWLSKILHIELVWVYKAILPAFLACVPLIMYFVFKKQFGETRAYWASLFFVVVPVMSLEIVSMAKAMVAEAFFALTVLVFISDLRQLHKGVILPILAVLTLLCHYTVGLILLGFLVACLGVMLINKLRKVKGKVSLVTLVLVVLLPSTVGYFYFSEIYDGVMMDIVTRVAKTSTVNVIRNAEKLSVIPEKTVLQPPNTKQDDFVYPEESTTQESTTQESTTQESTTFYINRQSRLVKAGIGLDFAAATLWGKAFRVIQYLTQLLIVLGLIRLWKRRREYNFTPEFVAFMLASFVLLGCCVFIPLLSRVTNMTRLYHLSLFFLAPLFVLGCEMIWNKKLFLPVLLLVYFAFTSGVVFEATRSEAFDVVDLPYSMPLSNERTGIAGVYNDDDLTCTKWLIDESNQELVILLDVNTKRLLQGFIDRYPRIHKDAGPYYRPWTLWSVPDSDRYYVFLSTWNVEHNRAVLYYDYGCTVGMRTIREIPREVYDLPVAFQSGKSVVLVKE